MSRELLQKCLARMYGSGGPYWADDLCAEIRTALAQPEAEPVAYGMRREDGQIFDCVVPDEQKRYPGEYTVPLYAAPQPAPAVPDGDVVVSKNERGDIVAVTRQDSEGRILSVIAESAAPAVPVSWERLRALMDGIPTREEFIGGQRQQYVAKEAVMGWLYEGQLRAEREAALSAAPAVQPLTDAQVNSVLAALLIARRYVLTNPEQHACVAYAINVVKAHHGIAAPGSAPAAPAVLEPLTDEKRGFLVMEHLGPLALAGGKLSIYDAFMLGIDAAQRAHGITGDSNG